MEAVEIIEGLNQCYEQIYGNGKGYFIVHKSIEVNPTAKAYKTYKIEVWFVRDKIKNSVITVQVTSKVTTDAEEIRLNKDLNIELSKMAFLFMASGRFHNCADYGEHSSKQVSD